MNRVIIFLILSIPVIFISRRALFDPKHHGFYRFFSWECIIWLFAANYTYWFKDFFSFNQLISWILLIISGYLVIAGVVLMKKFGKSASARKEESLYKFEKTTELVEQGIFKQIRHPLYSSLIFLTWGIFLKNTSLELLVVSVLSTIFLFLTAVSDEKECIGFFGDKYLDYMKRTKRFIPYII